MELRPREAASCATTQELPGILWNPKVHYLVHNAPSVVDTLSQINPVHITPSYQSKTILISHRSWYYYPSGFPTNNQYAFVFSPVRATCPAHLIFLGLIILIVHCEEYRLWIPGFQSLFGPNIALEQAVWKYISRESATTADDQSINMYIWCWNTWNNRWHVIPKRRQAPTVLHGYTTQNIVRSSKMSVDFYQIIWRYTTKDRTFLWNVGRFLPNYTTTFTFFSVFCAACQYLKHFIVFSTLVTFENLQNHYMFRPNLAILRC
jgi:hypothetical protein